MPKADVNKSMYHSDLVEDCIDLKCEIDSLERELYVE